MLSNPTRDSCIPKLDKNYDPGAVDDLLEDTQSFDEKERISGNAVEPLYEELKKVYDWTEEETKSKPRVKGDQRMYYGANDKLDPADRMVEPFKEPEEIHGPTKTYASSPNLLPLLLARDGSGGPEVSATPYAAASPGRREGPANAGNASRSNYLALKTTDDMFKGGSEQSNSTGEKLRGPSVIGAAAEWRAQKVSGVRNGAAPGKDAAGWSLTNRGRYIDTDSRSPYENGKYLESQPPREPGRVRNIDREKQTVISSRDLHESFVEPLEWIDDFDEDATVRLSRSLKTVDANANIAYIESNTIVQEKSLVNGSTVDTVRAVESTTLKSAASKVALVARPSLDAPQLLRSEVRIKRDAAFPRDAIYDDANQRDEEVSNNVQLSNSYEDADDARQKLSDSNKELEEYDVLDDEDEYEKVARSANSKRKKHVTKKKSKKQKKRKARIITRTSRRAKLVETKRKVTATRKSIVLK
ncbi:unnamed protein product [Xylocopa violacea]|uniref:Uncharacterized protein n=1 Tax=Xylocopa violacea TaxID=135666 RepID=A0ABP1PEU6_XYLVO